VSASTAVADAASAVTSGRATRVVVAAGFLVNSDDFASFDAGRVLADDGAVRPFSTGRRGLLLGDAAVAVVLESAAAARSRQVTALAWITGWGATGDAYHVCQPHPGGHGLARAITRALSLAKLAPADVGYLNANGTGTPQSDAAEAAALHSALGPDVARIPVSSTKSVHGHALEASGLLELVVTTLALRAGQLPVNAGFVGPDQGCELDLVLAGRRAPRTPYALTVNSAFGGANTALVVRAA
jgi:3-oxoacyl-(acyl-carrier-protein) synthase